MKKSVHSRVAAAVTACLLLPLVNVTVFRGLGLFFLTEPLKYPAVIPATLAFVYEFLRGALSFLPPLCITYAVLSRKNRVSTVLIAFFSAPVIYAVMALEDRIINSQIFDADAFRTAALDIAAVMLGYAAVAAAAVITSRLSGKAPKSIELFSVRGLFSRGAVISTLITAVFVLTAQAFETYALVMTYGSPSSSSEVTELAAPYITALIGALISYMVGCAVIKRQEGSHKSRELRK